MSRKKKNTISILLNLTIVIFTVLSLVRISIYGLDGNMSGGYKNPYMFFTIDSNILCAVSALLVLLSFVFDNAPKWVMAFKLISTTSVTITFLVVLLMLGPSMGYWEVYYGANLYMHLLTPIAAILSFVFFDPKKSLRGRCHLYSVLPVFIYGSVYLYNVIIAKNWHDFYGFNSGPLRGLWYISYPSMLIIAFLLSALIYKLHKVCD